MPVTTHSGTTGHVTVTLWSTPREYIRGVKLNQAIGAQEGQAFEVPFQSLKDIFHSTPEAVLGGTRARQIQLPVLQHFLSTTVSIETEFCRQALTLACQPDRASLRSLIKGQDLAIVPLYRSFSRFMLEDLALHPCSQSISRSQRKKTAEKIPYEMFLRNQAYSNLVELFFPVHIRLSIHAHVNSGPKFGISLFDRSKTRVIDDLHDLTSIAKPSHDLLHIPTPWHNCVFQVSQSDLTYITKSRVIKEAWMSNLVQAHWQEDTYSASGGYFQIDAFESTQTDQTTAISSSKSSIVSSVHEKIIPTVEDVGIRVKRGSENPWGFTFCDIKSLLRYCRTRSSHSRATKEKCGAFWVMDSDSSTHSQYLPLLVAVEAQAETSHHQISTIRAEDTSLTLAYFCWFLKETHRSNILQLKFISIEIFSLSSSTWGKILWCGGDIIHEYSGSRPAQVSRRSCFVVFCR